MSAPPNNLGTELWFANVADANDGFTNLHANRELGGKDARVYRELLQNAMDASLGNGGSKCEVDVVLLTVPKSDIPHIATYEQAFKKAKALKSGSEPQSGQQVIQRIGSALAQEKLRCLVCVDNGKGIGAKELGSLYGSGASTKQASGRGSVGHGHFAAFSVSDLRYVLYAGKTEPKPSGTALTFGGQALLATHIAGAGANEQQKSSRGLIRQTDDKQPTLFTDIRGGNRIPGFIDDLMKDGTGAATVVVAHDTLTKPKDATITTPDVVAATAVIEFMVAVYDGALYLTTYDKGSNTPKVTVGHHDGGSPEMLSCMSDRLEKHPIQRHKTDGKRRLKVLINGKRLPDADIAARLGAGVRVWMRATLDRDDTKTTKVSIFRDGMLIEDNPYRLKPSNFADRKPFHAVVDLQDRGDGSFAQLVREAEGTTHSKITESEITDKPHKAALKEHLEALRDVLRAEANKDTATEDYIPPELALLMGALVSKPKRPVAPHEIETETDDADDHDSHQPDPNGETEDEGGEGDGSSQNNGANKAANPSPKQKALKPGNSKDIASVCFRDANDPTTFHVHWELKPGAQQGGNVEVRLCLPVGTDLTSLQPGDYQHLPISTNKNHDGSDATDPVIVPLNGGTVQVWLKRPQSIDDLDLGLVRADVVRRSAATQQESADDA